MNLYQTFTEARLKFDTQRAEQIELARQALELKIAQRDFIKAAGEIKVALAKLEATKAAPTAPKAASVAPEAKTKPVSKASSKKTTKPVSKPTPKRPTRTLGEVEAALATIAAKVAALGSHLSK